MHLQKKVLPAPTSPLKNIALGSIDKLVTKSQAVLQVASGELLRTLK